MAIQRHPLETPEIIQAVGLHIPLWEDNSYDHENIFDFHPKDLLACCSVSKLWRAVLLPVLWSIYGLDSEGMWSVPHKVIYKYCHYFQHVFGDFREEDSDLGRGSYMHFPRSLDLSSNSDLCRVPWIRHLSLERWSVVDEFEFCHYFATHFHYLESITLTQLHNFDQFPSSAEVYMPKSAEAAELLETWSPKSDQPFFPVVPSVTHVKINFQLNRESRESQRLLEVYKCFPNVKKVHLHGSWMTSLRANRTQDFACFCPKVRWLRIQIHESELQFADYKPRDKDVAHLVRSLGGGHLQAFYCNVMKLGKALMESIVAQYKTPEVFEYHQDYSSSETSDNDYINDDGTTINMRSTCGNLNRILAACSRLRHFSLTYWSGDRIEEGDEHPLFVRPWGCMETLQELHLHTLISARVAHCVEERRSCYDDRYIWRRKPQEGAEAGLMESHVLNMAMLMPKLRRLTVDSIEYVLLDKE
ncbi:hypothetical protein MVEG_12185 [Podila verticillata NRRL 6337]|uniref:F-box domain-containing protein n=1 Tax=Podila verticillata NRRL 6337 TaxID=1069443 RepID=A0A086TJA4_9FUNG|nr:hypothetical protein MVEG_12185 [Podila verticillata NRRL 6337]